MNRYTVTVLEALSKDKPLGITIEQLLEESPTFKKKSNLRVLKRVEINYLHILQLYMGLLVY